MEDVSDHQKQVNDGCNDFTFGNQIMHCPGSHCKVEWLFSFCHHLMPVLLKNNQSVVEICHYLKIWMAAW